jgi:excinuclease UvrABC helicase subunit UvrB
VHSQSVTILDTADKGVFTETCSLTQTIGRAAKVKWKKAIMYATNKITAEHAKKQWTKPNDIAANDKLQHKHNITPQAKQKKLKAHL